MFNTIEIDRSNLTIMGVGVRKRLDTKSQPTRQQKCFRTIYERND